MTKPVIVIVPGAWHQAIHYQLLTDRLQQAGYDVHALTLPCTGDNPSQDVWKDDIAHIRATIERASDSGRDVVVVMHSRGGLPGGDAVEGMSKADRGQQGKAGGVVHLVYISSFAASEGVSLSDVAGEPAPWIRLTEDKSMIYPETAGQVFYNDCPTQVAEEQKKHIRPIPPSVLSAHKARYAAWKHIPSTYMVCEQDNAIPLAAQEALISQPGAQFRVERCSASHSPFLSMPDLTAEVVRRAAGEQV
ncbi:hypothetical protein KC354_g10408 [Hortaea werneckii]|nr:hypothetical protein KC354_g10408 [Hortaea werneckii]